MEQEIIKLTEQIDNVGRKTIRTYEEGTFAEQENIKKQMQRYSEECSDIFKQYIGIVPSKVIENITTQSNELLKKEIGQSRTNECRDTMERLGKSRKSSIEEMSKGIKEFKEQGVSKDNSYDDKVDEITNRVIKAYRNVLEKSPLKNAESALDEIKGCSRRTFNNIKEVHDECSKIIEKTVDKEIENFENTLSQSQIKNTDIKSDKTMLDFGEQLRNEYCSSQEEIEVNDIRDISQDNSQTIDKSREELESMFK